MMTRENFTGPWAGVPVAWTQEDEFDEQTYRTDIAQCCQAGVPGVYTGGTTGEFYAMEFDEFQTVTRATIEVCRAHNTPVMIGCGSTYTRGAARRVALAAELGADAVQVILPYWIELGDAQIVPFFKEVAAAAGDLAISIYESTQVRKILTVGQHRAIKDAVPNYLMVKSNAGTLGATPDGCAALSEFVNVFVGERLWAKLGPHGAKGCCSAMVYWNPRIILQLWSDVEKQNWSAVDEGCRRLEELVEFVLKHFVPKGFTDSAFDRMGGRASGFLKTSLHNRGPYPSATEQDVQTLRQWYQQHYPEMLQL